MVSRRRSKRQPIVQPHHAATRSRSKVSTNLLDHSEAPYGNRKVLDCRDGSLRRSTRYSTRQRTKLIQQKTQEHPQWQGQEISRPRRKARRNLTGKRSVGTVGKKGSSITRIGSIYPQESVEKLEDPPPSLSQDRDSPRSRTESEANATLSRHLELKRSEEEKRMTAMKQYQKTGDMSVFTPFVAPFLDGPDKPDLGSWVWDSSVDRWRREHKLNGEIIWGPTEDSFI